MNKIIEIFNKNLKMRKKRKNLWNNKNRKNWEIKNLN